MSKEKISTEGDFDSETASKVSWDAHRKRIMTKYNINEEKDEEEE